MNTKPTNLLCQMCERLSELDPRHQFSTDADFSQRAASMALRTVFPGCKEPFTLLIVLDCPDGAADVSFFEANVPPHRALQCALDERGSSTP